MKRDFRPQNIESKVKKLAEPTRDGLDSSSLSNRVCEDGAIIAAEHAHHMRVARPRLRHASIDPTM